MVTLKILMSLPVTLMVELVFKEMDRFTGLMMPEILKTTPMELSVGFPCQETTCQRRLQYDK